MQYPAIFPARKNYIFLMKNCDIFLIFAQNIHRGYTLDHFIAAVLTSTHNLCLRAKIREKMYTPVNLFYYIKVGCKGVYITRTLIA